MTSIIIIIISIIIIIIIAVSKKCYKNILTVSNGTKYRYCVQIFLLKYGNGNG